MVRRQPGAKRTDTRFPDQTLFGSVGGEAGDHVAPHEPVLRPAVQEHDRQVIAVGRAGLGDMEAHAPCVDAAVRDAFHLGHRDAHSERTRSEAHTYELQSLMRISYAVLRLKKKKHTTQHTHNK